MRFLHSIALLGALAPLDVPDILQEPGYDIAREGDHWIVRKPGFGARRQVVTSRHPDRNAAELHRKTLPRLRLSGPLVRFDPATKTRTVIDDWTTQEDAKEIEADVRGILDRFAPAGTHLLLQSTPLYMTRLLGATGHTAEESGDPVRFVIYLDPFRATGRLHAAATILHELTHVERYRARGFHANRAAAVLPKRDFVLLGLADEFAAYHAEAALVRSFLDSPANAEARRAAPGVMQRPELRWPLALAVMLGFAGPGGQARATIEARRQVILDLERTAGGYWESRHTDSIDPPLRQTIRNWYEHSREWQEIAAERPEWTKAESELRRSDP